MAWYDSIAGGVIGGIGSLITSALSSESAQSLNRQSIEFELAKAQNGYQWATEDMKKAGLNPALMYGSGSAASTGSPQLINSGAAWADTAKDISRSIQNALDRELKEEQINVQESIAESNEANAAAATKRAETEAKLADAEIDQMKVNTARGTWIPVSYQSGWGANLSHRGGWYSFQYHNPPHV